MSATVAIRIDEKLKKQNGRIFKDISSDPFYSKANQTRLRKAIADLNAGKGKVHELVEVAGA